MRFAKLLLAAIIAVVALVAGVVAAAVVALLGIIALVARHFLGPRRPASALPRAAHSKPATRMNSDGVIDVTATEVPADPSHR